MIHAKELDDSFKFAVAELCLQSSDEASLEKFVEAIEHVVPIELLIRSKHSFWKKSHLLLARSSEVLAEICLEDEQLLFDLVDVVGSGMPEKVGMLTNFNFEHPLFFAPLLNTILSLQEVAKVNPDYVSATFMARMKESLEKAKAAKAKPNRGVITNLAQYFGWVVSKVILRLLCKTFL